MGVFSMITIDVGSIEHFDPKTNRFTYEEGGVVRFEYSLKALYEWEGVWLKPFLNTTDELTQEEIQDFYHKMALDPVSKKFITNEVAIQLSDYISETSTATVFSEPPASNGPKRRGSGKSHTAEEIYSLMFSAYIPLELENRNLNRLMVMLKIISSQNSPSKKMSKQDVLRQNTSLNEKRKAKHNTKG